MNTKQWTLVTLAALGVSAAGYTALQADPGMGAEGEALYMEGPVNYAATYGVSAAAASQLERIERLGLRGIWTDGEGDWVAAYRAFPRYSHDWTTVLVFASDQAITFWPDGAGPLPGQRLVLEGLVMDMLVDPSPTDHQLWSAIALAGQLDIDERADIAALMQAHARDDETRGWIDRFAGD